MSRNLEAIQSGVAASFEDLRPGALIASVHFDETGGYGFHQELEVTSYPARTNIGPRDALFVDTVSAGYKPSEMSVYERVFLADHAVVPYPDGRYNQTIKALLLRPAGETDQVYTDRQREAVNTPFSKLDSLGKILVGAHIKVQTGKLPKDF